MLYRIEVGVLHAAPKVFFAANQVFPISPLPDASLALCDAAGSAMLAVRHVACEVTFDETPTKREVGIVRWKRPYGVQVLGKDRHRIDCEWVALARVADGGAESIDAVSQQSALTIGEVHGEEVRSAGDFGAAVVGHPWPWVGVRVGRGRDGFRGAQPILRKG